MYQYIITISTYEDIARKILKSYQFYIYKLKLNALIGIISKRLKKYLSKEYKNKKVYIEESEDRNYLEKEKQKLEAFLFSDSSELRKDEYKEYGNIINHRLMSKLINNAHKYKNSIKDKAITLALGGNTVIDLLNKLGIIIKYEIK